MWHLVVMVKHHSGDSRWSINKIKKLPKPFILSCHCVAHRTNLATLDAFKISDCNVISDEVDTILNAIVFYFNNSSKRKYALTILQTIIFYTKEIMKRYHKIRWLSRWQAVTTLYDSLESVLCFFVM